MKTKHLLWLIPICIFIGWTVGFWIGIPKHITFSSDDSLIDLIDYAELRFKNITNYTLERLPNCSRVNYNITSYLTYDTGSYSKLLSELKDCNTNREFAFAIIDNCKDRSWCNCEETGTNPIIDNVLYGNNRNKRFCIWKPFQDKNCAFTENDIRILISNMPIESEIEVMRWEDIK